LKVQVSPNLILVGTAHVSPQSVAEVEQVIREEQPDVVAVELDAHRLDAIMNPDRWQATPIQKLLKSDKLWLFLAQSLLASQQRRIGEEFGVQPGQEMLTAVQQAKAANKELLLADRDISITMQRAYRLMKFREKMRLIWELFKAMMPGEEQKEELSLEKLMQEDTITQMMDEMGRVAPSIKSVIIDERDTYLATKVRAPAEAGKKVVAVVGAGHLKGIQKRLQEPPVDLAAIEVVPKKRFPLSKILGWGLPLSILVLFAYFGYQGFQEGNFQKILDAAIYWILITGGFAALGAALGRGHILSILTAFVAAPITTLHPALAAGWFAGLTEATVRTPTVKDFQGLSQVKRAKDFFGNRVFRVLMVAAFANLGAMVGFFIAGGDLLRRFLEG
jgi:pheromone shutdown-related protein TraB